MKANSRRTAGFTLIEILVVMVLIGLLAGVAVLTVAGDQRGREMTGEMARLRALLELYSEEAIEKNRELGIYIDSEGYEFLEFDVDENEWQTSEQEMFQAREFPEWLSIELLSEEELPTLIDETKSDETVELADLDREEKTPLLLLLSSGETTPFQLFFRYPGSEADDYAITSDGYSGIRLSTPESE